VNLPLQESLLALTHQEKQKSLGKRLKGTKSSPLIWRNSSVVNAEYDYYVGLHLKGRGEEGESLNSVLAKKGPFARNVNVREC